jgi:competence ComEA-like helix-hairpin-helix protein
MKKISNKNLFLLFSCILLLNLIDATCNSTQVNLNTASLEELDKITGIGPTYAGRIIEMRQFSSVDDLINVSGIGIKTLNKIKEQGLACVDNNEIKKEEIIENNSINEPEKEIIKYTETNNAEPEITNLTPIALNIKSENNKEILKGNLPFYGIISFCIIFGVLFLLNKRKNKNEFRQ